MNIKKEKEINPYDTPHMREHLAREGRSIDLMEEAQNFDWSFYKVGATSSLKDNINSISHCLDTNPANDETIAVLEETLSQLEGFNYASFKRLKKLCAEVLQDEKNPLKRSA
mgnify:CR=1 FL=1